MHRSEKVRQPKIDVRRNEPRLSYMHC